MELTIKPIADQNNKYGQSRVVRGIGLSPFVTLVIPLLIVKSCFLLSFFIGMVNSLFLSSLKTCHQLSCLRRLVGFSDKIFMADRYIIVQHLLVFHFNDKPRSPANKLHIFHLKIRLFISFN